MATAKKRNLGAAKHPDPSSPGSGDRVVSAEIVETLGEKVRDAGSFAGQRIRKSHQRRSERKAAPSRGQRKRYERERNREQRQIRREAEQGDPLALLKLDTQRAQEQFLRYLRESDITAPGQSEREQRRKLGSQHQEYVSRMVDHCLKPLRRGLSVKNVLSTVGMSTAMWVLSPNFRAHVGDRAAQIVAGMGWSSDRRPQRGAETIGRGENPRAEAAARYADTGSGRGGMSRGNRRRLERMERMKPGDRDPFSEHSAALTHVGIVQNAYDQMRKPGADRELVKRNCESALNALYGYVAADGLDREAVERDVRVTVGRLIEHDPAQAAVFSELGHGRLIKGEPQNVILPDTGRSAKLWTGDYVDVSDGDVTTRGVFTLREPMSTEEHRAEVARSMYGELSRAHGPTEFSEALEQYAIGAATRRYPESVELTTDATARARLDRSRTMFASMQDDGLSGEEQKMAYLSGFMEAWREVERTHPQKSAQWKQELGPEWEPQMRDLIREYRDFGERPSPEGEQGAEAGGRGEAGQESPGEPSKPQEEAEESAVPREEGPLQQESEPGRSRTGSSSKTEEGLNSSSSDIQKKLFSQRGQEGGGMPASRPRSSEGPEFGG